MGDDAGPTPVRPERGASPPHPQVHDLVDELIASGRPSSRTLPLPEGRRNFAELVGSLADIEPLGGIEDRQVPVGDHWVTVRIYRPPASVNPAVTAYFHGGGWVFGDLDTGDPFCRSLCTQSGVAVVSVDYRLAPEWPYPAAREDCTAVIRWVADHAGELGVDGRRLGLVGDSSGGNLAAAVALHLRDHGGPELRYQVLVYPVTDATMSTASYIENADDPFLSRDELVWYWEQYGQDAEKGDPYLAPAAAADLSGLPPALVLTAGLDPLRDEGQDYATRLQQAGVPTRLLHYPDMPHGFLLFSARLTAAQTATSELATALASAMKA